MGGNAYDASALFMVGLLRSALRPGARREGVRHETLIVMREAWRCTWRRADRMNLADLVLEEIFADPHIMRLMFVRSPKALSPMSPADQRLFEMGL